MVTSMLLKSSARIYVYFEIGKKINDTKIVFPLYVQSLKSQISFAYFPFSVEMTWVAGSH